MKKMTTMLGVSVLFILMTTQIHAQTATGTNTLVMGIPAIALLNTTSAPINLQLTTATAGEAISGGEGTAYVQISSIVSDGHSRKITASVNNVPAGTTLDVTTAIPSNANYGGTVGAGTNQVGLSAVAVDIVTGIGSCYTGVNGNDGYKLDYKWNAGSPQNYGNIIETSNFNATVTLTITDDTF